MNSRLLCVIWLKTINLTPFPHLKDQGDATFSTPQESCSSWAPVSLSLSLSPASRDTISHAGLYCKSCIFMLFTLHERQTWTYLLCLSEGGGWGGVRGDSTAASGARPPAPEDQSLGAAAPERPLCLGGGTAPLLIYSSSKWLMLLCKSIPH